MRSLAPLLPKRSKAMTASSAPESALHSCLNCGTPLSGAYCAHCGQAAHVHRSLHSLGHDILHGVFHFEGKFWSTLPQLFFFPGRLTRRYIDGERAKFVSPMALFLFTVFSMFAVFSVTTGSMTGGADEATAAMRATKSGNLQGKRETHRRAEQQLKNRSLSAQKRATLTVDLQELKRSRSVMKSLAKGGLSELEHLAQRFDRSR